MTGLVNHKIAKEIARTFVNATEGKKNCVFVGPAEIGKSQIGYWVYQEFSGASHCVHIPGSQAHDPVDLLDCIYRSLPVSVGLHQSDVDKTDDTQTSSVVRSVSVKGSTNINVIAESSSAYGSYRSEIAFANKRLAQLIKDLHSCKPSKPILIIIDNIDVLEGKFQSWAKYSLLQVSRHVDFVKVILFCREFSPEHCDYADKVYTDITEIKAITDEEEILSFLDATRREVYGESIEIREIIKKTAKFFGEDHARLIGWIKTVLAS